jgi:hypothetical protein
MEFDEPTEPTEPAEPTEPTEPNEPMESVELVEPVEPDELESDASDEEEEPAGTCSLEYTQFLASRGAPALKLSRKHTANWRSNGTRTNLKMGECPLCSEKCRTGGLRDLVGSGETQALRQIRRRGSA